MKVLKERRFETPHRGDVVRDREIMKWSSKQTKKMADVYQVIEISSILHDVFFEFWQTIPNEMATFEGKKNSDN